GGGGPGLARALGGGADPCVPGTDRRRPPQAGGAGRVSGFMGGLSLYLRRVQAAVRAKMQYKGDFVTGLLLYAVLSATDFLMIAAILTRFPRLGGWDVYEVGLLYGMASIATGLYRTLGAELHSFERYLLRGEFDELLLRPRLSLLTIMWRGVDPQRAASALERAIGLSPCPHPPIEARGLAALQAAHEAAPLQFWTLVPFPLALRSSTFGLWAVPVH